MGWNRAFSRRKLRAQLLVYRGFQTFQSKNPKVEWTDFRVFSGAQSNLKSLDYQKLHILIEGDEESGQNRLAFLIEQLVKESSGYEIGRSKGLNPMGLDVRELRLSVSFAMLLEYDLSRSAPKAHPLFGFGQTLFLAGRAFYKKSDAI